MAELQKKKFEEDKKRTKSLYAFDANFTDNRQLIVGLDEVGRGSLAGPLAVGAVVIKPEPVIAGINDSKKLTAKKREALCAQIQRDSLVWHVEFLDACEIDSLGMAEAIKYTFKKSLFEAEKKFANLSTKKIGIVLVDGNPLRIDPREINVIQGDAKSASISCASIVAKHLRDSLMVELSDQYPEYMLDSNKGYGSAKHIAAIREHGLSPIHRITFSKNFV
ncbi:MAG: ribonuclease HII [Eggerthellaceae bacterium]|nr:ribonuclease HII [Eggerthellaceae bacterium]